MEILSYILFLIFLAALIVAGGLLVRGYISSGSSPGSFAGSLFGPRPDRRLEVIDQISMDGRRKLVIIRRDDIEHLVMTGGPVDVVIETGIGAKTAVAAPTVAIKRAVPRPATDPATPTSSDGGSGGPVFGRVARQLGQAVGDT